MTTEIPDPAYIPPRTAVPGDRLPEVPDACYPPGAVPLDEPDGARCPVNGRSPLRCGHSHAQDAAPFKRPEGCICVMFRDTGGFRIADLTCPVHGVAGSDPGDGYWEAADAVTDDNDETWSAAELHAAMGQAHRTGISITCSQDRHGSCFGCRCDCH